MFHVTQRKRLGDCFYIAHLLHKLCRAYDDVQFYLYVRSSYIGEVKAFVYDMEDRIIVKPLTQRPQEGCHVGGWLGEQQYVEPLKLREDNQHYVGIYPMGRRFCFCLNQRYGAWYDILCKDYFHLDNPIPFESSLILDEPSINTPPKEIVDADLLLVNSHAKSGQHVGHPYELWEKWINEAKQHFNVITTLRPRTSTLTDVPCTTDFKYNLCNIGYVSTKVKVVVGVVTSPLIPTFNKWNIDTVKKWVSLGNRHIYAYNERCCRTHRITRVPPNPSIYDYRGDGPPYAETVLPSLLESK